MAEFIGHDFNLSDPSVQALFDRTPQQREAYGRHMLTLIAEGIGPLQQPFAIEMGIRMHGDFLKGVQRAVDVRRGRTENPVTEEVARREVAAEIAELHQKLPLRGVRMPGGPRA